MSSSPTHWTISPASPTNAQIAGGDSSLAAAASSSSSAFSFGGGAAGSSSPASSPPASSSSPLSTSPAGGVSFLEALQMPTPNVVTKKCCVVGCETKREKEGYCMPHYQLFKASPEAGKANKAQEKQLEMIAKERAKIQKEQAEKRAKREKENEKAQTMHAASGGAAASASAAASSSSSSSSATSASTSGKSHWWKRGGGGAATLPTPGTSAAAAQQAASATSCFSAEDGRVPQALDESNNLIPIPASASIVGGGGAASSSSSASHSSSSSSSSSQTASTTSPPSFSDILLSEVRHAWSSAHKVVFKDVPRLSRRTSIQTDELGVIVEAGKFVNPKVQINGRASVVSAGAPGKKSLRAPRGQARAHSIGDWENWKGIENETWTGKEEMRRKNKAREEELRRQEREAQAAAETESLAALSLGESAVQKDGEEEEKKGDAPTTQDGEDSDSGVPPASSPNAAAASAAASSSSSATASLASHPQKALSASNSPILSPVASPTGASGAKEVEDTWQAVCNVLLTTCEQLETPQVIEATRQALDSASVKMHQGSDHQSVLEAIFTDTLTLRSRTYRIFQAVHQSILFPAIAHLHQHLYSKPGIGNLKDCRRSDGWTVLIYIGAAIYITHTRWEQSLHAEHDPRHFEVRWEMRLSFDKGMEKLRACILRIQELRFHEQAEEKYKREIQEVLRASGYIV